VCLTLLASGSWMGGGPLGAASVPLEEASARGVGVVLGVAEGACGEAGGVEPADGPVDEPLAAGCVL
jgi:hypothetical protein